MIATAEKSRRATAVVKAEPFVTDRQLRKYFKRLTGESKIAALLILETFKRNSALFKVVHRNLLKDVFDAEGNLRGQ